MPGAYESRTSELIARFAASVCGSLAVKFALFAPVLLLVGGATADYNILYSQKSRLQAAADTGSLAAAKELGLADAQRDNVQAIVEGVVESYLKENHDQTYGGGSVTVAATYDTAALEINVTATQEIHTPFRNLVGSNITQITVNSVARIVGRPNICVLALELSDQGAITLQHSARLTGNNCAVFSNSTSAKGLAVRESAQLSANTVCSAGGAVGSGSIVPSAITDCPQFEDPLLGRPEPTVGACDYSKLQINDQDYVLRPGVYCDGLVINGKSKVTLEPGVYIIHDGPFKLSGWAEITGTNVGFYLSGTAAFEFGPNSTVSLTAPKDGPLTGLLVFGSRSQDTNIKNVVRSNNARELLGTIYLPRNAFVVDATSPVGDRSAYTAIVARQLMLFSGPNLVLNSNYEQTDVPVPVGIRGADQPIALVK